MDKVGYHHINAELVRAFCKYWCAEWGVGFKEDIQLWVTVIQKADSLIQKKWINTNPSPFKQSAAIAMAIVSCAPIDPHVPQTLIDKLGLDEKLARQPKLFPAIVAHDFVILILKDAEIGSENPPKVLEQALDISFHFYQDLLWALTRAAYEDGTLFNPLSLIYESCAYQTNPKAQGKR